MKNKDNELLANAFRKLSEAISEIADALESTDEKKKDTPEPASIPVKDETDTPDVNISFEEIRTVLAGKAGKGYRSEVKEILIKHKASCLSDLESRPEEFAEIFKEAEAIGND